jgi:hypothetical protein
VRLAVFTCLAVLGLSQQSLALPLCDDEQSLMPASEIAAEIAAEFASESDRAAAAHPDVKPLEGPRTVDVILPCAVAESGDLGPLCVDATVWLLTQTGVVLCQVTLFEAAFEPLSIEQRPTDTLATMSTFAAAGLLTSTDRLALPLVHDRFLAPLAHASSVGTTVVESQIVPG